MKKKPTKIILIILSILFLTIMLVIPLIMILISAFSAGITVYWQAITNKYTLKALGLTLFSTLISVAINTFFGLFSAWAITRFQFKGKQLIKSCIDIPFAVSPVIAGLMLVLVFGRIGLLHPLLEKYNIQIIFAVPSVVIATVFVTFPFISRELIPVLEARGTQEEEAAAMLGANGWVIFEKITFPHIKWALLYGIVLCTARAMGEFGAVSVVSGHLRGKTNTLPLHIELLYNEFNFTAAFAVSTLLFFLAVIVLILRYKIEQKGEKNVR